VNLELFLLLTMGNLDTDVGEGLQEAIDQGLVPLALGRVEHVGEVLNITGTADLDGRLGKTHLRQEGAIGNIYVDREGWDSVAIEDWTDRSEDTLEGFDTIAKREALLTTSLEVVNL
jgi:hypothetical protein